MSTPRLWTLHGFDVTQSFDSIGQMKDKPNYVSIDKLRTWEAGFRMKADPIIGKMVYLPRLSPIDHDHLSLNLFFITNLDKDDRKKVVDILNAWGEKSRVKNCRGFRAYAMRRPMLINHTDGFADIKVEFIFGHTIHYSNHTMKIDMLNDAHRTHEDVQLLMKQIKRECKFIRDESGLVEIRYKLNNKGTFIV